MAGRSDIERNPWKGEHSLSLTFNELGLSEKVLAAISTAGYTTPTPIQIRAIPVAVEGRDVLGIAQTGTGKTASYVLPMLTRLERGRARARMPRSLILAPTRELAAQVAENFDRYGANHKLNLALIIGGVSFDDQDRKLDRGVDVLIATPGRLLDHFTRGKLLLTGVEILVIDEADRMLDMGFIPDIERICSLLPAKRQTLFFSATMPPEIQRLVDRFLQSPEKIEVAPQATTAGTIEQRFQFVSGDPREKRDALRELIRSQQVKNAIIFCNRKKDVDILFKSLQKHGFNAGCLHGDMDQMSRTATLDGFRSGKISLLAASDVAARGLDIPDVSHIFNFDVPIHAEDYVHRIGRTGRAGKKGFSATLVTDYDIRALDEIQKMVKTEFQWLGDPPPADAGTKRRGRGRPVPPRASERSHRPIRDGVREHARRPAADSAVEAAPMPPGAEQPDAGGPIAAEARVPQPRRERPAREPRQEREARLQREQMPADEPKPEREARPAREERPHREPRRDEQPRLEQPRLEQPRLEQQRAEPHRAERPRFDRPVERPNERPRESRDSRRPTDHRDRPAPVRPEDALRGPPPNRPQPDRRPHHDDGGRSPVGLGDHVPDFLKRAVKIPTDTGG